MLIYDFGGGTFDVSLLKVEFGKVQVLAVGGDNHLGGDDVDRAMMRHCLDEFESQSDIVLDKTTNEGAVALMRLKRECEKKKWELSTTNSARIVVNNLIGIENLSVQISKREFNDMNKELFDKTMICVNDVMEKAGKTVRDIDDVILVGGSTRIPYVRELLAQMFGKEPRKHVHVDLAVAEGAAIQAAILNGKQAQKLSTLTIEDMTPFTIGIGILNDCMSPLIPAQSLIPCCKDGIYITTEDNQTTATVEVLSGESAVASENRKLGEFTIRGLPPLPAGEAKIKVVFDLNMDGILKVRALDPETNETKAGIDVVEDKGRLTAKELKDRVI